MLKKTYQSVKYVELWDVYEELHEYFRALDQSFLKWYLLGDKILEGWINWRDPQWVQLFVCIYNSLYTLNLNLVDKSLIWANTTFSNLFCIEQS